MVNIIGETCKVQLPSGVINFRTIIVKLFNKEEVGEEEESEEDADKEVE